MKDSRSDFTKLDVGTPNERPIMSEEPERSIEVSLPGHSTPDVRTPIGREANSREAWTMAAAQVIVAMHK